MMKMLNRVVRLVLEVSISTVSHYFSRKDINNRGMCKEQKIFFDFSSHQSGILLWELYKSSPVLDAVED